MPHPLLPPSPMPMRLPPLAMRPSLPRAMPLRTPMPLPLPVAMPPRMLTLLAEMPMLLRVVLTTARP